METWLDTTEIQEEEFFDDYLDYEKEYFKEEMENFISRYEKRYNTSVNSILLIAERESFYGDWNPAAGRVGYRLIKDLDNVLGMSSDDVKIYVGDDKLIHMDFYDHDGVNCSVVKLIPGSVEDEIYNDLGCYACELDYAELLKKQGQLKPTKFWQAR